jgi:hypothetical protein
MTVSGNVTARGQSVDINESFVQLVQKSDSVIGYMGYFEANKGRVGFFGDVVWAKLNFDRGNAFFRNPLPGLQLSATTSTALTYSTTIVEAAGLYEFAHWPGAWLSSSPDSFTALDGFLGFRYWNTSIDANLDVLTSVDVTPLGFERNRGFAIAHSGSLDWVDPIIGLRLRHKFTPAQQIMLMSDVGGFGLQSTFEWQAVGVYSYAWQFTGYQLAAVIGYRALGVDYSRSSGIASSGANVVLHGPLLGLSIRF